MAGGMRGPAPKDPRLRQRRNKVTTAAELPGEGRVQLRTPGVPKGFSWGAETRRWWRDLWRSPMAVEFIGMDLHPLYRLGHLIETLLKLRGQLARYEGPDGLVEGQDFVIRALRERTREDPDMTLVLELNNAIALRAKLADQVLKIQMQILKQEQEIRAHEQRYGLTSLDRRRLQWEIEPDGREHKSPRRGAPVVEGEPEEPAVAPPRVDPRFRLAN